MESPEKRHQAIFGARELATLAWPSGALRDEPHPWSRSGSADAPQRASVHSFRHSVGRDGAYFVGAFRSGPSSRNKGGTRMLPAWPRPIRSKG